MASFVDRTGQRFGKLVAKSFVRKNRIILWRCECDCGGVCYISSMNFGRNKQAKSCGCLRGAKAKHGDALAGRVNNLYHVWAGMRARCNYKKHKSYHRYGGRGITVCDEWKSYVAFKEWAIAAGYNKSLTLDRTDNNKGYSPDNCRWVTMKENSNNRDFYQEVDLISIERSEYEALIKVARAAKNVLPKVFEVKREGVLVPCPDNKPGCLVAHIEYRDEYSRLHDALAELERGDD